MRDHVTNLSGFMKAKEFAALINVTPECVRSWIFRGRVPVRRFGRAVRIEKGVAQRIIREGLPKNDGTE